jgi:hypothetical protein
MLLSYYSHDLVAQTGFFIVYPMEYVSIGFLSLEVHDDKLYVYSQALDTSVNLWGMDISEFDTLGQFVKGLTFTDPLGTSHVATNGIISGGLLTKNDTGLFAGTGSFFNRKNLFVIKVDTSLNWYQLFENTDTTVTFDNPFHIFSYDGGLLVSGSRSKVGFSSTHKFIMYLDESLEEVWNNILITQNSTSSKRSAYMVNQKVFSGSILGFSGSTPADAIRYSVFETFDMNGEILNSWQTDIGEEEGVQIMELTPDLGFIYSTMSIDFLPDNLFSFYPRLVRRDSTYQKLWEVELPVSGSDQNRVMGITRSLDGHWLVTAKLYTELAGSPGSPRMAPCVFKISDEGEILWSTCVTFPYEWVNNQYPSFRVGNVIQISSGSIYVVGSVNRSNPSRTLGWMLKLDKDGCLNENPCHPPPDTTVSVSNPNLLSENNKARLHIHPNPTSSTATVQIPGPGRLALYDLQGRLLRQEAIPAYQLDSPTAHELQINTNTLPAGMYMLVFYGDDGFVYRGKLGIF